MGQRTGTIATEQGLSFRENISAAGMRSSPGSRQPQGKVVRKSGKAVLEVREFVVRRVGCPEAMNSGSLSFLS